MGSFFDDIGKRAEARRNLSFAKQKSLIDSGITTPSLTNGSVDGSLTAEQAQAKTELLDQKDRQAYSDLMALPVGAVEGMLGIGGDIELLGQGIKGAYNADSGNRWEGFKEGLSDRDTMFWSTLDNQERTDKWLEGTEFGDRLKEGAGGRLVGEILAPLPIPKGTSALAKGVGKTVADSLTGTGVSSVNTGMFRGIKNLRDMGKDPAMFIGNNAKTWDRASEAKALKMERAGVSPEKIWEETGTARFKDGRWRQEIDDSQAYAKPIKKGAVNKLDEAIYHPELFEAYPDLADINFRYGGKRGQGYYAPSEKRINVGNASGTNPLVHPDMLKNLNVDDLLPGGKFEGMNNNQLQRQMAEDAILKEAESFAVNGELPAKLEAKYQKQIDSLKDKFPDTDTGDFFADLDMSLHETMHGIQHKERFAKGGDPYAMAKEAKEAGEVVTDEVSRLNRLASRAVKDVDELEQRKLATSYNDKKLHKKLDNEIATKKSEYQALQKERDSLVKANVTDKGRTGNTLLDGFNDYYKLGGEAESRLVELRRKMTPAERRANFPYDNTSKFGIDRKWDDLIIKGHNNDGTVIPDMMSIKPKKANTADDSIDSVLAKDDYWKNLNKSPVSPVNSNGIDATGYNPRVSDRAFGNSQQPELVDLPKGYDRFDLQPNSAISERTIGSALDNGTWKPKVDGKKPAKGGIDSLLIDKNKQRFWDTINTKPTLSSPFEGHLPKEYTDDWENIFGNPTGSPKPNANRRVNADLGLTYDGSEFPASLDPKAVKLTPNGRPTKAPQPEVDPFGDLTDEAFNIVTDANGNKIRQPKGNLNIKDMSYEDLQKAMSKDIEIQTPRGTLYRNLDDYTDSLEMGLDPATGKMQSPIYDAKNIDESVRNANKNDTHFTGDMADIGRKNIKDVELDTTINKVHDLVYDEVPTALNKSDRVVDGKTIRPINDYLDGLEVKGTVANGKLKTIKDLANNNFNSLDTKLNSLTRILDDVQTAVPKTTFNKRSQETIIDAVHHAMFDAFEQAYKTNNIDAVAKKTIDTQLDKLITLKNADGTTSQSLKLVPRKGDSAKVMKRSPNHRRQRVEKDRGSPDIERLPANDTPTQNRGLLDADDYEALQDTGSQGYNSGEGANTFKNTYTPASSTRRTKSKDAPKRSKRSKLNSKEEEELMPWLEDLPNYNFKGYR